MDGLCGRQAQESQTHKVRTVKTESLWNIARCCARDGRAPPSDKNTNLNPLADPQPLPHTAVRFYG
jgi:hypothetical protein